MRGGRGSPTLPQGPTRVGNPGSTRAWAGVGDVMGARDCNSFAWPNSSGVDGVGVRVALRRAVASSSRARGLLTGVWTGGRATRVGRHAVARAGPGAGACSAPRGHGVVDGWRQWWVDVRD